MQCTATGTTSSAIRDHHKISHLSEADGLHHHHQGQQYHTHRALLSLPPVYMVLLVVDELASISASFDEITLDITLLLQ